MGKKEINTLNKFIQSNKEFYITINDSSQSTQQLNEHLKVELLMLYFSINKPIIKNINTKLSWLILSLLESQNFFLDNVGLNYQNQYFTIDYLTAFALLIEKTRKKDYIANSEDDTIIYCPKNSKVIPFPVFNNQLSYSNQERCKMFELTNKIDQFTKPYIEEINNKFTNIINDMLINLVTNSGTDMSPIYLNVLFSFISLYPYLIYAQDKADFPFASLNLPQNEIGLMKSSDSNSEIKNIALKIKDIDSTHEKLSRQKKYIELYTPNNISLQTRISNTLLNLEKAKKDQIFNYCIKKLSSEVYNKDLLEYMLKSFIQGNIDINEKYRDPIVKMFFIENGEVEFHSAMHISSLIKIIQSLSFEIVPVATKQKIPKK